MKKYFVLFLALFFFLSFAQTVPAQYGYDEQYIKDLYKSSLGRLPDSNALNYYLNELGKGRGRDDIKAEIENSKEAKSYEAAHGPQILSFVAQKAGSNTWYLSWNTKNADSVVASLQCISGVNWFYTADSRVFTCDTKQTFGANSGFSLNFTNTSGWGRTVNMKLYPVLSYSPYTNKTQTVSFFVGKTETPKAPLTSPLTPSGGKSPSAPTQTKTTAKTSSPSVSASKVTSVDSFTVEDNVSLGSKVKRLSWKISNAKGAYLSIPCVSGLSVIIVTKAGTNKVFNCGDKGQRFLSSDSVNLRFSNKSKSEVTVTVKLFPVLNNGVTASKAVTKSFKIAS